MDKCCAAHYTMGEENAIWQERERAALLVESMIGVCSHVHVIELLQAIANSIRHGHKCVDASHLDHTKTEVQAFLTKDCHNS